MSGSHYWVESAGSARRSLNQVPEKAATAATEFCFGPLAANPYRVGKPLTRDLTGHHAARRGGYRVVYRIDENAQVVNVVRIDHRSDVFRPR